MDTADKAFHRIKRDLDAVSAELAQLISTYQLQVDTPLDIIQTARDTITNGEDYVRFLELSLQGRLLAEAADYILQAKAHPPPLH